MTKKILIDARMYGLENSGIGRYVINLINELQKLDTENEYVILLRSKYFNQMNNLPRNWTKVKVDIRHYSLAEQLRLPFIIAKQKPDLVHFPHFNEPVFWGGSFVVTIHDMTMHKQGTSATTLPLPLYYLKRLPYKLVFMDAVIRAKKIIVPSKAVMNEVVNYYKVKNKKVVVTYEGLRSDFTRPLVGKGSVEALSSYGIINKDYFFYIGNAYPHKNLENAISAAALLNGELNREIYFVIAGSRNVFTERLERIVKKYKAEKFVKIIGRVSDSILPVLYRNSLAFIYPSLAEGFGLQGLEAFASETMLITSDIPVFREIYNDNALYFDPKDPRSICESMKTIVKMSIEEKEKRAAKAHEFIKRYSWNSMATQTLEVYKSIMTSV